MGRGDEAIKLAVEGRWEEAVLTNQAIIEVSPSDVGAHNRLGKALAELGRNSEARQAYKLVLELDPKNTIAQRNLHRLNYLKDEQKSQNGTRGIDCKLFTQDTSKARVVGLNKAARREVLAKMSAGDEVLLQPSGAKLLVTDDSGEYLGEVESKIGSRLVQLMVGGNQYKAAIASVRDDHAKVIIRETLRHPSQLKHPSFLPKAAEELRPYLKGSMVKHDIDDEFAEELGEGGSWESDDDGYGKDDLGGQDGEAASDKGDVRNYA